MTLLLSLALYLALSALVAGVPHLFRRVRVFGGFWGSWTVAFLGCVVGGFAFDWILLRLHDGLVLALHALAWLMKNSDARILPPVNLVAAFCGALLLIVIFHRITPGRGK